MQFCFAISCNIPCGKPSQMRVQTMKADRRQTASLRLTDRKWLDSDSLRSWAEISVLLILICFTARALRPQRFHVHPQRSPRSAHSRFTDSSDPCVDVSATARLCAPASLSGQVPSLSTFWSCLDLVFIATPPAEMSANVGLPSLRAPPSLAS